jgi:hypothetical protein
VKVAQRRCGSGFSRDEAAAAREVASRLKPLPPGGGLPFAVGLDLPEAAASEQKISVQWISGSVDQWSEEWGTYTSDESQRSSCG